MKLKWHNKKGMIVSNSFVINDPIYKNISRLKKHIWIYRIPSPLSNKDFKMAKNDLLGVRVLFEIVNERIIYLSTTGKRPKNIIIFISTLRKIDFPSIIAAKEFAQKIVA